MAVDLEQFKYSFSHASIKMADTQYLGISNVQFNQDTDRSAVYGTSRSPLGRSKGQIGMGEGTITFSDLGDAMAFYAGLGADPSSALFTVEVTFENEAGNTQSFELLSCSLSGFAADFAQGADAMGLEYNFDFLRLKVNGAEWATD